MDEETLEPAGAAETLEWITVLCAAGLDYRLSREGGRWRLHVPSGQAAAARGEIAAYERERMPPPPPEPASWPAPADAAPAWTAFWMAYALVLFYLWLGPFDADMPVLRAGAAQAGRIQAGEWWRAITALTLHAGIPHLLGNAFFILFIAPPVLRIAGRGLGLLLMLAGGMLGNLAAAYGTDPLQTGVGASTLCFAALGILSLHQCVVHYRRYRRWNAVWRRAWLPMAAGLAMLGMTGTGPQSDLAAHALGFAAGAALAMPLSLFGRARISGAGQWLLTAVAAALPALGWFLALAS